MTNNSEPKKVQIVGFVQTNTENPWRTQGDYREEQKEARERHEMFQEQHKAIIESNSLISKSHKAVIISAVFTGIVALATCITLGLSIYETLNNKQSNTLKPTKIEQKAENIKN